LAVLTRLHDRIEYEGIYCTMTVQQLSDDVVVVRIEGTDIGEFGERPLRMMDRVIATTGDRPLSLFIDARAVRGASLTASSAWGVWLTMHSSSLRRVHMLARSTFVMVTANFVRRFAKLEDKMAILSRDEDFDLALGQALRSPATA
jgi:hypothetical protein